GLAHAGGGGFAAGGTAAHLARRGPRPHLGITPCPGRRVPAAGPGAAPEPRGRRIAGPRVGRPGHARFCLRRIDCRGRRLARHAPGRRDRRSERADRGAQRRPGIGPVGRVSDIRCRCPAGRARAPVPGLMDHFEKVYDQLRREYLAGADARLAELRAEVESLRAGDREAASRLRARLHRLAGSGGSHGFPEISSAAREAEVMLRERGAGPADADALDDVVDRLAVAFSEAESSMRGGPPETGLPRLAVLVATDSADSVEWRESLARAGFGVRQVPAGAGPLTVGGGETAQLVVVAGTDESVYATTAAWAAAP